MFVVGLLMLLVNLYVSVDEGLVVVDEGELVVVDHPRHPVDQTIDPQLA